MDNWSFYIIKNGLQHILVFQMIQYIVCENIMEKFQGGAKYTLSHGPGPHQHSCLVTRFSR